MAVHASPGPLNREGTPLAGAPSVAARIGLVLYALLITYASWFPFTGWRNNGLAPWAFVSAAMPHYWTVFDLITNVIAYIPIGILAVFALYPRLRGAPAMLAALAVGTLLSAGMEAGQTYLPSRVASNLDLLTNTGGAAIGAIVGRFASHAFLEQSRLLSLRRHWFSHEASRGLIVLALWPLAQIYPQAYLFGHGQLLPLASAWLGELLDRPLDLGVLLRQGRDLSAEQYWLAESIITATGLAGAVLTMMFLFRERAPKAALAGLLVAAALASKSLANAVIFGPDNAFLWLTPGSQAGLLIGALMLSGLMFAPPPAQRRVAGLALVTALVAVNLVPANPYFVATLQTWSQGKFLNFNGAAQLLSLSWPFFMLWFLYHPVHRRK
ncbi:VanZ family protein [Lacisediminimonas profundi]|uniref:VanZ family protein n=1 Tax=Lacisediminimonas profundi TaxID=2603856 RepID=UPI00124AEBF1|nr:VanZ family protein [Lacisediminimonas profundi]